MIDDDGVIRYADYDYALRYQNLETCRVFRRI